MLHTCYFSPVAKTTRYLLLILFICYSITFDSSGRNPSNLSGWKAGVAKTTITPEEFIWMAGYASREYPAKGKIHDLWAKALALEDASGNRSVLITADILGFPQDVSNRIRERLKSEMNLSKAQIILNASHTHSGPVLTGALIDIYPVNINEDKGISHYTAWLESQIVRLVSDAFQAMTAAELYAGNGVTRFLVNRRNNNESTLKEQTALKGPNDYAVPVIKVTDTKGRVQAIVFGYACHPTTLDGYAWCGDYPGFAQLELEKLYPGSTALFFQGACGDQNPLPRRTVPLAIQHGLTLAVAVDRMLQEKMQQLPPVLTVAYKEINLPLTAPPTNEELEKAARESQTPYYKRWAARLAGQMANGQELPTSYPYPLQLWNMGGQTLISLGGEVVIEYAIGLKRMFGHDIFVMGYSNDVMAYIPSVKILREGGYEGASSQMAYGLPSVWSEEIEPLIYQGIKEIASSVGLDERQFDIFQE
jgi:hypothetical protein